MNQFKTNYQDLRERAKALEEAIQNSNMPERARIVLRGHLESSVEQAQRCGIETAKGMLENISIYLK